MKRIEKPIQFLGSIVLCHSAGFIGSLATTPNIDPWYNTLNKPFFTPPSWVFAPVWLTLYTLMGIALYLILNSPRSQRKKQALILFYSQLVLNTLWSIVFFGRQMIFGGLVIIAVLIITLTLTIYKAYPLSRKAAWLLIPYLAWVSFATLLNYSLWLLNR